MTAARTAGAIGGALLAGLGLTAMMMAGERKTGKPSELIDLERASLGRLGRATAPADRLPAPREQALVQGGHLVLSLLAGATFAAIVDEEAAVVPSGILFGLAFYGVAHWLTVPLLGVKPPEWRSDAATTGMHAANHVAFGLATAAGARLASSAAAGSA